MRIALMSAWNTDSGVAVHAEPLGKAWTQMGHKLIVFTFVRDDFHGEGFTGEDEDFVIRCFGTDGRTKYLDPRPFLTTDYDVFVVQDLGELPKDNLAKIFDFIKRKAKTVHIVHENALPDDSSFYQFDWDAVVYFDERQSFLRNVYPNTHYIPFPCFPPRQGDKEQARHKLGLPLDKKIVLSFCQRGYSLFLPERDHELDGVIFLVVGPERLDVLEKFSPDPDTVIREEEVLSKERFDDYLFASDAVIFHKFQSRGHAVVSSTAFQALGAGCLILVPRVSDFFRPLGLEILRYAGREELRANLTDVLQEGPKAKEAHQAAMKYTERCSPETVAKSYIELFESLLRGTR
jgi:hypothetical protein